MSRTLTRSADTPPAGPGLTRAGDVGPWSRLSELRDEMLSLFGPLDPQPWALFAARDGGAAPSALRWPALDVSEAEDAYTVSAELPGLSTDQIAVRVRNGTLTISGEKSDDRREDRESYHLRERSWGRFQRSLSLPEGIDADQISARCADGVLTVRIPKSASTAPAERTISIASA